MGRWLGIDHGTARIGVSAGNTSDGIAAPVRVLQASGFDEVASSIAEIAREYGAEGIVVGWPLNMDDTEGPQARTVREFAARLANATGADVRLWDERLTSFHADGVLAGMFTRKQRKARQDAVAAAAILQDFLASGGPQGAPRPDEVTD